MIKEIYICDNCHKEVDRLYCFCPPMINSRHIDYDDRDSSRIELCKCCSDELIQITRSFKKPVEEGFCDVGFQD